MKDIKRLIPGALISIAIIAAILYFVDFDVLLKALQRGRLSHPCGCNDLVLFVDVRARKGMADFIARPSHL